MRAHAYILPSDAYKDLEAQILESLRDGDQDQLRHLLSDHDLDIELLSGEWRILMAEFEDHYQVVDDERRISRMAVSPDELPEFVAGLRDPDRKQRWRPISFGLAELVDALPLESRLAGVVIVEEADDWMWAEPVYELVAIRPEVFALLEPHLRKQLAAKDFRGLARLAEDHAEGCVEFSPEQWRVLLRHSQERVPELVSVYQTRVAVPSDYTQIREALALVADPRYQPSLDAWLRVHADTSQYALYFRDASLERPEFEVSGLFPLPRSTQKLRIPPPGESLASADGDDDAVERNRPGHTVPLSAAERARAACNTDSSAPGPPDPPDPEDYDE